MLRTDLALEAKEMYHENADNTSEIEGVRAKTEDCDGITVTTVEILNEQGKSALQKEIGTYITIEMPAFREHGQLFYQSGSCAVKKAILQLTDIKKGDDVLIVGLGNRNITPDALGSLVTDKLIVTRHLHTLMPDAVKDLGILSCMAPGVMGITGIETADIIGQMVKLVKPKAVFAIDALAARSLTRISTTVQLSDTGISPGSGIGNRRATLSKSTLGVPVIAIGVPMVIDSETLIHDAFLSRNLPHLTKDFPFGQSEQLIVTPKDIDRILGHMSSLVAAGINMAMHGLNLDEIADFVG